MAILLALFVSLAAAFFSYYTNAAHSLPDEVLRYLMLISNGFILVATAMSHLFKPAFMARELGWPPGGPFQRVVGYWNLGAGAVSIASFWIGGGFLVAGAIVTGVFWTGAASLHWQSVRKGERDANRLATATGETVLAVLLFTLAWNYTGSSGA